MSYFAIINTVTNVCENFIVAETQELANNATPQYCTAVEFAPTPNPIIGLTYDWETETFVDPTTMLEEE
jgi:hypothetical protein